jgi:two-component system phosphate regulon sensor histidine kinase PhoR
VDPVGRTPTEILRNADLQEAIQRVLWGEPHLSLEIRTLGIYPKVLEVHVVGLSDKERQTGAVAVFHDVTERKRLEEVRRDFVANLSHELRTPLTAIRGAVEALRGGGVDAPQHAKRFLEIMERHVVRLQGLLDDLLNLARIESREAHPKREEIRGSQLAENVLASVAELASSRGIDLVSELPEQEITIRGDRQQLEQALVNLLDNAIKYTERGGTVTLRMDREGEKVRVLVKDTGIGIAPDHLPRIFERFYRADKARSRELGGTGLGLSIVKHIVQSHGGRVEVESFPGMGSTFRIILPG